jgi:hypothetical protein
MSVWCHEEVNIVTSWIEMLSFGDRSIHALKSMRLPSNEIISNFFKKCICCFLGFWIKSQLCTHTHEGVSINFRTGRLKRELQMVQPSATRCSCIAILWLSLVGFAAIILCVASQLVFIIVLVYFVIDSVGKLLDTPSYVVQTLHSNPVSVSRF